jgi:hypothetical protein
VRYCGYLLLSSRNLSEFEFRFNRRACHAPTHHFQRLMEGAVRDGYSPYRMIVGRP